ncbi:ABC transporter ATP-binding protein [Methylobacterium soli]|uniref:ATP-binding cassette domain-containing protein n=1 Tax=Methylobacterium soli TaxID=553447 RepID=A0A6L3T0M7_9HYPH|nr:oligopeptide/dipeptide ABC transporter ATP-binding protein [Methylobacterium soli]KAB1079310.1 ATP-binding cassette domain-containing protein [Methylobacterium soli]GJE43395.1 Vitamin B12 import ATP-binding protein BtuD [Methylobacterium soli]
MLQSNPLYRSTPELKAKPLLAVEDLAVHYRTARGTSRAVDGISLEIHQSETLGLVGESGCGKSTLGRAILRLVEPSRGSIRLDGRELVGLSQTALRGERRRLQMVFQDSGAALDPRWTVGQLIEEPLRVHGIGSLAERRARVARLLADVGLPADAAARYPHAFSGGQRQRIGLARAIALEPDLVVCDEPVSALDVSIQAQILNLLHDLQARRGVAFLFISHDLSVVEHVSDRVAVMYLGRIVEIAAREALWRAPAHPYTRKLLAAVPSLERRGRRAGRGIDHHDTLPSPYSPPSGCHFHPRCPMAVERCRAEVPSLRVTSGAGHRVACHLA